MTTAEMIQHIHDLAECAKFELRDNKGESAAGRLERIAFWAQQAAGELGYPVVQGS